MTAMIFRLMLAGLLTLMIEAAFAETVTTRQFFDSAQVRNMQIAVTEACRKDLSMSMPSP